MKLRFEEWNNTLSYELNDFLTSRILCRFFSSLNIEDEKVIVLFEININRIFCKLDEQEEMGEL